MQCTLQELQDLTTAFRKDRGWLDLPPEDLAKSIMIESAELLEHFQWSQRVREIGEAHELDREAIGQEIADIAIFLVELCRDMDYDLEQLVRSKLLTAAERYPIDYRSPEKGDHAAYRAAKEQDRRMY